MTIKEYNRCVDDCADGLFRFLLKNTKDEALASDLVQEAFLRVWEKRDVVNQSKSKTYLYTTAYHLMIDHFRKNKEQVDYETVAYQEQDKSSPYLGLKEVLDEALEKLPPIQKNVLLLRDYEGYSYKEIAEITDLNESQVKVYIYRARLFLKKFLVSIDNII